MTGVSEIMALAQEFSLPDQVLNPLERAANALPELPVQDLASADWMPVVSSWLPGI